MSGHGAEIDEIADLGGAEGDRRARALAGDARRLRILVGKVDVVLGALAVDERELDDLSLGGGQHGIDLAVDRRRRRRDRPCALRRCRCAACNAHRGRSRPPARARLRRRIGGGERPAWRQRLRCRRCRRGQIGDDVGAVMVGLEARERHPVSGHLLLRIGQISVERLGIPSDVGLLHRRRIIEVRQRAGLASDDAGQRGADKILAGLERVAGLAFAEHLPAGGGIARARTRCRNGECRLAAGLFCRAGHRHGMLRRCPRLCGGGIDCGLTDGRRRCARLGRFDGRGRRRLRRGAQLSSGSAKGALTIGRAAYRRLRGRDHVGGDADEGCNRTDADDENAPAADKPA